MAKHALLSASSAHRWLACPPSAVLCAKEPDISSEFALQGTDAHSLCEYKVNKLIGKPSADPTENLTYFDEEMSECTDIYAQYIAESISEAQQTCKDTIVLVEQRLDYSRWVPQGFGTGDCVIVADGKLKVVDFKYGVGVVVEAENNPQMMCYALGALDLFDSLYDIYEIEMVIFQPRRNHISSYTISKDELLYWADTVLAPTAKLAYEGKGEFNAGAHCKFCKIKANCRKRAEYNLELARYDFEMPSSLDDTEIEVVLAKADELISWAQDVKEYALAEALKGKQWNDWKVVEGRSNRKYINESVVAEKVEKAGYDPYEHRLRGITSMTKLLGRIKFEELLGELTEKPTGKPTLVPITDKRPVMDIGKTAANDFMEVE